MKIRNSFVSNSSSCSFVIGKAHMTNEQIKKFSKFISFLWDLQDNDEYTVIPEEYQDVLDIELVRDEGCECVPMESNYYFVGEADQHITPILAEYLKSIGVDDKYIECVQ